MIGHYVLLNRVRMVETRLYQMVHETQQELLSVLLLAVSVHGHHFPHEPFKFRERVLVFATKRGICAKEAALLIAEVAVLDDGRTRAVVVEGDRVSKTLQHGVEKAGVAHIRHSVSHPLLSRFHQRIDLSCISHLFKLTLEIFLKFLPLLPFFFELFPTLRSNSTSLWLLIKFFEPKEAGAIVIWFEHRVVIIAAPMLLPIVMVPIFVLTHRSLIKVLFV